MKPQGWLRRRRLLLPNSVSRSLRLFLFLWVFRLVGVLQKIVKKLVDIFMEQGNGPSHFFSDILVWLEETVLGQIEEYA